MAGESEALAAELKARKEGRDCNALDASGIGYEVSSNGAGGFNVKLDGKIQKSFKSYSEAETFIDKEQAEYRKKVQTWMSKK